MREKSQRFIALHFHFQSQFNFHEDILQDLAINQFQSDAIALEIFHKKKKKKLKKRKYKKKIH